MTTFKFKYVGLFLILSVLVVSCKNKKKKTEQPNQKKQQLIQQRRADSLRQVRQRRDSLRQARADSLAKIRKKKEEKANISLKSEGQYVIQVEAWRSKRKAQKRANLWEKRGFENAYTVIYHGPTPGDVWFRVRLGYTDSKQEAKKVKKRIMQKYQVNPWIEGSP